jgi:electron transfer flavoprotein alpha subunit
MNQDIYVVIEHLRRQVADISYVMLAAARTLAQATGGRTVGILLGYQVPELAADLAADEVWYVEHPALADFNSDSYQRVLVDLISTNPLKETSGAPRAMLLGDTSIGADVAGWLASRLTLPLVSYCRAVRAEVGTLKYVSQICGGRIMAEGELPAPQVLVTMVPGGFKPEQGRSDQAPEVIRLPAPPLEELRVKVTDFVEPASADVDIGREPILVSIGRGIQNQDNVALAEELAKALGGVVSASRPVVDQGWLPATRLVGKSGKTVKPRLYLALGISGAPEHVEAMADSELIIAINTDPTAPIFDLAQYGAELDLVDLLPALTEQVERVRHG